jgi:hypothetical protein
MRDLLTVFLVSLGLRIRIRRRTYPSVVAMLISHFEDDGSISNGSVLINYRWVFELSKIF